MSCFLVKDRCRGPRGGETLCFPPPVPTHRISKILVAWWWNFFLERAMHFRFPDNLSDGYTTKNRDFGDTSKKFFVKNSKNSYFLLLQILHWFSNIFKKIEKLIFSSWFKPSYIPELLSKKCHRECVRAAFISFLWIFEKYYSFLNVFVVPIQLRQDMFCIVTSTENRL